MTLDKHMRLTLISGKKKPGKAKKVLQHFLYIYKYFNVYFIFLTLWLSQFPCKSVNLFSKNGAQND